MIHEESNISSQTSWSTPVVPPVPLVVQPAMQFSDELTTPTQLGPTPLTADSLETSCNDPSLTGRSSPVKPSLMVNAAFTGDFSSMSLWEMEQLYAYNKAVLYKQKKLTKRIKDQLLKMQQHERVSKNKNLSRSDLYKRFLHFLVEPKCVPTCDLIKSYPTGKHTNVLDTSFDKPVLKKEFDVYGSLSKTAKA